MACPMAAKNAAMFNHFVDRNLQCAQSSSSSIVYMQVPASSISMLATKQFTRFQTTAIQLQHRLATAADRVARIKAMQSAQYTSSIPPSASSSTKNDAKAPLTLSEQWQEIQGEKHWEGLLDHPLNATLRAEIIRYGEFAQVCYDAFDFNQHSLYCGSCKYNRRGLFEKVDKEGCGYEVTKYLYATSKLDLPKFFKKSERKEEERWSCDSNWIGYIAVCTDEAEMRRLGRRDILIAWRGTVTKTEWVDDLMTTQVPANIEHAMNQPLYYVPFRHEPSQIQNANLEPANAASHRPLNPNVASILPSRCPPMMNINELHSSPQNGEGLNVKADNPSGNRRTLFFAAHGQTSAVYIDSNKDANKHGEAEKDIEKDNQAAPVRRDRPAAICKNGDLSETVKVESGFLSLYSSSKASSRFNKLSAGQQMAMEVKRLLQKYEGEEISISITGHSLGAALAILCAYDIAANVAQPQNTEVPRNTTLLTATVAAAIKSESPSNLGTPPIPGSLTAHSSRTLNAAATPHNTTSCSANTNSSLKVAPLPTTIACTVNPESSKNVSLVPITPAAAAASLISSHTMPDVTVPPQTAEEAVNPADSSWTSQLNLAAPPILAANNQAAEPAAVEDNSASLSMPRINDVDASTPTKASSILAADMIASPPEGGAADRKKVGASPPLITVFSFAGPRVGNRALKRRLEEVGVRVLRIVNVHDCVPKVPGVLFNERSPQVWPNTSGYHHVGKEILIDFDVSPHLRQTRDLPSHHNLEAHLHVLDGFHGFTHPFQSVFGRNPILVNKSSDFLRKEAFIPPSWWQESNKGLVKDPLSGQWVLASREDDHLPEIHNREPQAFTS